MDRFELNYIMCKIKKIIYFIYNIYSYFYIIKKSVTTLIFLNLKSIVFITYVSHKIKI